MNLGKKNVIVQVLYFKWLERANNDNVPRHCLLYEQTYEIIHRVHSIGVINNYDHCCDIACESNIMFTITSRYTFQLDSAVYERTLYVQTQRLEEK